MQKRPLCFCCLFFLGVRIILLLSGIWPSDLAASPIEKAGKEKDTVYVSGEIFRREENAEYDIYYLKQNSIYLNQKSENQISSNQKLSSQKSIHQKSLNQESIQEASLIVYQKKEESKQLKVKIGNQMQVVGQLAFFESPGNPGQFDQKFYYQKQKIHAMVWAEKIQVTAAGVNYLREALSQVRRRWNVRLISALGEEDGGTMSAILLGEKGGLDSELKDLYQKNGIGHILAISGLHMSFIGMGLYTVLRKRGCSFMVAGMTGILLLASYTLMIGCSVSSMRAVIMYVIRMGAEMTGRVYDTATSVALSAAIVILWRPLYILDAGFLLSYGAITGIYLLLPFFERLLRVEEKNPKLLKWFEEGICASLSINVGLLPILLYFYFEFPLYSFVLNLFVIPLMSWVLGAGILGSILYGIPLLGNVVLKSCTPVLSLYEASCRKALTLPFSRMVSGQPGMWQIVAYYAILLFLLMFQNWMITREEVKETKQQCIVQQRFLTERWMPYFLWGSLLLMSCILTFRPGMAGKVSVTMLDVGQGDGLCIRGPGGGVYFIDGGSSSVSKIGKYRLEPYLKSQGIGTIDYALISHGDRDHCSGIEELLANQNMGIRIHNLVLPQKKLWDENLAQLGKLAGSYGTRVLTIETGERITEGAMTLTCIQPDESYEGEIGNASSVVLGLQMGSFDMLCTGDVEGRGEELLTEQVKGRRYEVLKVAHHGSKNSSSAAFLQGVQPDYALISAGRDNRYGHPHTQTIERLEAAGSKLVSTVESGAIQVTSDGKTMKIEVYKE
ncbi:MAG: DNA internalization-related competence protein ComEC/Rec2 [Hespellia sp.]|nr:DNA internalization-related competence protein ComEC/Rec2 [Hespellia sp.]